LAKQGIPELNHHRYCPDLPPPDFFLSPKIKSKLKGEDFKTQRTLMLRNVTKELLAFMQMSLKSVSSNFMGEHKSV
jgi:hypothetical protein